MTSASDHVLYKGGFSTSIGTGLFAPPHNNIASSSSNGNVLPRHSDCCALTCCGLFLYDRNHYLLTRERPSWKGRCGSVLGVALLVCLFFVWLAMVSLSISVSNDDDDDDDDDDERPTIEEVDPAATMIMLGFCTLMGFLLVSCLIRSSLQRRGRRRQIVAKLYREHFPEEQFFDSQQQETNEQTALLATPSEETYLKLQEGNIRAATATCWCLSSDDVLPSSDDHETYHDNHRGGDLCSCLWRLWLSFCCDFGFATWCQLCGMCALGQEDRELQRMLPLEQFLMDYITFQPFYEYCGKLQSLRQNEVTSLWPHLTTLSELSRHLLSGLGIVLALLLAISLSHLHPWFQPIQFVVVLLTLLPSVALIYFIFWMWNRLDLSFDAVVKYFASGFLLCTVNAFVFEILLSWGINMLLSILVVIINVVRFVATPMDSSLNNAVWSDIVGEELVTDDFAPGPQEPPPGISRQSTPGVPFWVAVLMAFVRAFLIAATVEELTKYFSYWMVEHPDLVLDEDQQKIMAQLSNDTSNDGDNEQTTTEETALVTATNTASVVERTKTSLGAGITVAMTTTALGYACCENFIYVFVYTAPHTASVQIVTLFARSLFPVHPLAAALQSIGVCRRDIEGDSSMQLGRIILPAVMLHGSFDFGLMVLQAWVERQMEKQNGRDADFGNTTSHHQRHRHRHDYTGVATYSLLLDETNTTTPTAYPGLPSDSIEVFATALQFGMSISIVLIATIYYVVKARAQRARLQALDRQLQQQASF